MSLLELDGLERFNVLLSGRETLAEVSGLMTIRWYRKSRERRMKEDVKQQRRVAAWSIEKRQAMRTPAPSGTPHRSYRAQTEDFVSSTTTW